MKNNNSNESLRELATSSSVSYLVDEDGKIICKTTTTVFKPDSDDICDTESERNILKFSIIAILIAAVGSLIRLFLM